MKANGIGLPERKHYEIDIPVEDWPVPGPLELPDFIPEWMLPDEEEVPVS